MAPGSKTIQAAGMLAVLASGVVGLGQQPAAEALDPRAEDIFRRLESRQVDDLHAKFTWKVDAGPIEQGAGVEKVGEIWFKSTKPVPKFRAHFNQEKLDGRPRRLNEQHAFDGEWYVELRDSTQTVIKRQIRKSDDRTNPYRLGEGFFPLPFGQKRADILREFQVEVMPPADAADHLRLIPRPGSQTGERYKQVELWIANRGSHSGLPVKVAAIKKDGTGQPGEKVTVEFTQVEMQTGMSDTVLEIDTPPGFKEIIERLDDPAGQAEARRPARQP